MASTTFLKVSNMLKLQTIVLLLCWCCHVHSQQHLAPLQQQHQYQQLQYQMQHQQQQQYEYQQQMQQQQQNRYQQQYQEQQQQQLQQQPTATGPMSLALQQQQQQQKQQHLDNNEQYLAPTQTQLLKTGVSLVVDDGSRDGSVYDGQKEYTNSNDGFDGSGGEIQQPTRRRPGNRKRKRRPQLAALDATPIPRIEDEHSKYWRGQVEDDTLLAPSTSETNRREDTRPVNRRRKQPAIREPLAALEKEQKLYEMRDKKRQDEVTVVGGSGNKSYRRPYSQAKKELQGTTGTAETLLPTAGTVAGASVVGGGAGAKSQVDLKNILKNSGGMSLSEILQQKNLSLDDLLKGKQKALLALQTTAAAPAFKPESGGGSIRPAKPVRRLPTAHLGGPTVHTQSEETNSSNEGSSSSTENDEVHAKNKLKFPTLQRLKLFGSASRGAPTIQGNVDASTKRPTPSTTTTTTTSSTTTTPRVPIYKKRLQQRPTLKSPTLYKTIATATTTKEVPTSMETLLTTVASNQEQEPEPDQEVEVEDNEDEFSELAEETDENIEELTKAAEEKLESLEQKLAGAEEENEKTATTVVLSSTRRIPTTIKTTKTTTTTSTTTTTTTTTAKPTTRSRGTHAAETELPAPKQTNLRLKTTLSERVQDNNFIENDEAPTKSTKTSSSTSASSAESSYADDLENFFEDEQAERTETKSKSNESSSSTEEVEENIKSRVDRRKQKTPQKFPPVNSMPSLTSYYDEIPDFDGVDDRTDLLELIEDRRSSNRLFKVLEQRNMTLEELIEHRKRGSSQLHLSTIVQNRSRFFPGQKVVLNDNMDIVTAFENFPHFNLMDLKSVKPDDIKTDSQGSSYFTSIIDIEPTDEIYKDGGGSGVVGLAGVDGRGSTYTQPQRSEKSLGFFPSWKTLALASLATTSRDPNIKRNPFFLPQPKLLLENTSKELDDGEEEDDDENLVLNQRNNSDTVVDSLKSESNSAAIIDTVEAIENEVARAHDLLDLELSGHGFKRSPTAISASISHQKQQHGNLYTNMPAGIRSAIVASAAIVLTSLATFMVIFVVCRWKQRKRRKTNYMKTYNAMKSKMPQIATSSRRSSLQNMEEMVSGSGCVVSTVAVSSTSSASSPKPPPSLHHHHHQLQRQSSLLFPPTIRGGSRESLKGICTSSSSTNPLLSGRIGGIGLGSTLGNSSATGSTTSLALSLQSAHNISSTKLNTMDPNSPEVQEYLFDTLRKSF